MNPVQLGIIGCGIAARKLHFPALQKLKDKFEIVMVCNHTEPKAKSFSEMLGGVPYVLDYHELLNNPDIEAVLIILPIHLNYRVTLDSLKAGKHVLLEKPIAANLDEGRKMLLFKKLYPQVKMVAENFRYRKTFYQVKELLESEKIGIPYAAIWNVLYQIKPDNQYAQTEWRKHHQYPGGFITDGGVHNVAALRLLLGDIVNTYSFSKSVNPEIGEVDTFSMQFQTDQNVHGILNLFFAPIGFDVNELHILGEKGSMTIHGNDVTVKLLDNSINKISVKDDGGYSNQLLDFYDAIRKNTKTKSPFEESFRDFEIIIESLNKSF
jgi:predicted dehydrogenase